MRDFLSFDPKLLVYGFAILFFASFGQTFFISIYNLEIREFYILTDGEFGLVYALGTLFSSLILVGFAGERAPARGDSPLARPTDTSKPDEAPQLPEPKTHYMGREIAQTMHFLGAPWLVRESREREEDC